MPILAQIIGAMKNNILFSEKQRFHQWWLIVILAGVNILFLYGIVQQIMLGEPWGDKPASDLGLIIIALLSLLLTLLLLNIRLDTRINTDGIYVRFYPFQRTYRYFAWDSLSKSYVRTYSPIAEYGGWGWRLGLFGKGNAYNISGNQGLQLEFKNGKKILIGTAKPQEITEVLKKIYQYRA